MRAVARLSIIVSFASFYPPSTGVPLLFGGPQKQARPTYNGRPTYDGRRAGLLSRPAVQSGTQPATGTALWVAQQINERDTGKDARFAMRMRLYDRQGRARERVLSLISRRDPEKGDRLLVRFEYPNDIKGTAFLVWEHPKGDDERFLYLPALGRVRRIAGSESQESFVGTDFSYEDIGGREIDDYEYAFVDENATWTAPDGKAHAAWQLASKSRKPNPVYPRVVSLVLKSSFVVVHADIFNRRDEREKVYDVRRLEQVESIWTVMKAVVSNERARTRTELELTAADYNIGLTEEHFTRRALERGSP